MAKNINRIFAKKTFYKGKRLCILALTAAKKGVKYEIYNANIEDDNCSFQQKHGLRSDGKYFHKLCDIQLKLKFYELFLL